MDWLTIINNPYSRAILDKINLIFDSFFNFLLFLTIVLSLTYLTITIYTFFSKRKSQERYDFYEEKAPFVTVQIPTYNELAAIQCAKKCLEFDYPKDKYEIIIGDDSSNKEVSRRISTFAKSHKLIRITRRGNNLGYKAGNLNHMLKFSKGELLVIFDSDFAPPEDFLRKIVVPFRDSSVGAVQARWNISNANQNIISILGSTITSVCHQIILPFTFRKKKLSFLCGSAEAVRKDVLIKLGGWKHGSLTEDIEYSLRLLKNGYSIIYLEDLTCDGEAPHKPVDLYRQQMRWAYGVISSFKEHGYSILTNKKKVAEEKVYIYLTISGYMLSFLIMSLFLTGFISFITHRPEPINLSLFFSELGRNVLFTSGLVVTAIVAQGMNKNAKSMMRVIGSFFSYGFVVVYYVNKGILSALFNKKMEWFMLSKNANKI